MPKNEIRKPTKKNRRQPLSSQRAKSVQGGTKRLAMKAAQSLLQKYGYSGFSFQHVADLIGIQKASLFEHFGSKEELGQALIHEYHDSFERWIQLTSSFQARDRIFALFELFYEFSKDGRKFCPLTALIPELNSLPEGLAKPLRRMHEAQRTWLQSAIEAGKKTKDFKTKTSSAELADLMMSIAYGAQLSARIARDPERIRTARDQALALLKSSISP